MNESFMNQGSRVQTSNTNPFPVTPRDAWLEHAKDVIRGTYGDEVSVREKAKDLLKFGHNDAVGTSFATVAHQPTGILHETYVSDNLINSVVSTDAGDTTEAKIEGHTIDANGDFTFVVQTVTLTGQTAAALTTPLARVTRMYNNNSTDWVGTISITETDTYTAGVPDTAAKVHLQIEAGENQSEKCSTTISSVDYWIVTSVYADYLDKTAGAIEVALQIRLKGKVFRNQIRLGGGDGTVADHHFKPYLIVPPNTDVRLITSADGAGTSVSGGIEGVLAKVVG